MDNKEFAKKLEYRTRQFGIAIIKLSSTLPNTIEAKVIKNQVTKSGTSIGAIIEKLIDLGVREISRIKLKFLKAKQVKPSIG